MVTENGNKTTLKSLIESEAMSKPYRYDEQKGMIYGRGETFLASKQEFLRREKHHNICILLTALSHEFGRYPYTSLVYFAIGSSAHKQSAFHKGYTKIDTKKARKILKWLTRLAKHCGDDKYLRYDVIVHGISKFYDKISQEDKVFNETLDRFNPDGRKPSSFKTMDAFYSEFMSTMLNKIII